MSAISGRRGDGSAARGNSRLSLFLPYPVEYQRQVDGDGSFGDCRKAKPSDDSYDVVDKILARESGLYNQYVRNPAVRFDGDIETDLAAQIGFGSQIFGVGVIHHPFLIEYDIHDGFDRPVSFRRG